MSTAALTALAGLALAPTTAPAARSCAARRAKVLERTSELLIFERAGQDANPGEVFACSLAGNRRRDLGPDGSGLLSQGTFGLLATDGQYLVYSESTEYSSSSGSQSRDRQVWLDVRSGRRQTLYQATTITSTSPPNGTPYQTHSSTTSSGILFATARLGRRGRAVVGASADAGVVKLYTQRFRKRRRLLDSGTATSLPLPSISVHGHTASWAKDGTRRTASI